MKHFNKFLFIILMTALLFVMQIRPTKSAVIQNSLVLYDGALGGTPDSQSLTYANPDGFASQSYASGSTTLDTTLINLSLAGYGASAGETGSPELHRSVGYTLEFVGKVESESHSNNDRAGFSVLLLSEDSKGIELGFWNNEIWAQEDDSNAPGDLFTHAEGTTFNTTAAFVTYTLNIITDTYTLIANDVSILSGPLRDYTNFVSPFEVDPYEVPSSIFLGDNTTSANAKIKIRYVAITASSPYYIYIPLIMRSE